VTISNLVIVTHIWQKLSSVEREVKLIVTHYWQLFSQIFGETLLIVRNIWRNPCAGYASISVQNQEVTSHEEDIIATHLMGECKGKERGKPSFSLFLERI